MVVGLLYFKAAISTLLDMVSAMNINRLKFPKSYGQKAFSKMIIHRIPTSLNKAIK